jgi:hypothetical protein
MAEANRLFRPDQYERQPRDFYPTPAWVTACLTDTVPLRGFIWEPCAGQGLMAKTKIRSPTALEDARDAVQTAGNAQPFADLVGFAHGGRSLGLSRCRQQLRAKSRC